MLLKYPGKSWSLEKPMNAPAPPPTHTHTPEQGHSEAAGTRRPTLHGAAIKPAIDAEHGHVLGRLGLDHKKNPSSHDRATKMQF